MIRGPLAHPEVLAALAGAGHGSRVLVSDFNYPHATRLGPNAALVFANFAPGLVRATDILGCLAASVPIEAAVVMSPGEGAPDPAVWEEYRRVLAERGSVAEPLERLSRHEFYGVASGPDLCLTIATGETSLYANILLTIGAIAPD